MKNWGMVGGDGDTQASLSSGPDIPNRSVLQWHYSCKMLPGHWCPITLSIKGNVESLGPSTTVPFSLLKRDKLFHDWTGQKSHVVNFHCYCFCSQGVSEWQLIETILCGFLLRISWNEKSCLREKRTSVNVLWHRIFGMGKAFEYLVCLAVEELSVPSSIVLSDKRLEMHTSLICVQKECLDHL